MVMRKGGWKPAALAQRDIHIIVGATVLWATIRGFDYVTGDNAPQRQTAVAEVVMPLQWWAICLWSAVAVLLLGWWQRRHAFVFAGHAMFTVLYTSLSLGLFGSYVADFVAFGVKGFVFDGVRNVGPLVTIAMLHGFLTVRTGTHPLERDIDLVADETIIKKGGADE